MVPADQPGSVTVVGDDDQAIYGFQGASGSFTPYLKAFPSSATVILAQNYRSTTTIVQASSALVGRNVQRTPKHVFSSGARGERILIAECRTVADECRWVIEGVRHMMAAGRRPREMAILWRTSRVGVALQAALCSATLPFNTHAINLWETKPLRELRCACKDRRHPLFPLTPVLSLHYA